MHPARRLAGSLTAALVAVLAAAGLMLAGAGPAAAHNGAGAAFAGPAGPYTVYAYDGSPADRPGYVAYQVIILETASEAPVDRARATVVASSSVTDNTASRQLRVAATPVANVYQYVLPDPGAGTWRIRLSVDGPLGSGVATYTMHGPEDAEPASTPAAATAPAAAADTTPWWRQAGTLVALVAAVVVVALAAVSWRRRRAVRP